MKDAASEANMTVVAIILIGIIVAVATPIITSMMKTTQKRACCQSNGGIWENGACSGASSECSD